MTSFAGLSATGCPPKTWWLPSGATTFVCKSRLPTVGQLPRYDNRMRERIAENHRIGRDISVLSDQLEAPGVGFIPVNAFVLHAAEPVVVDTGLSLPDRDFLASLGAVVDPADVQWVDDHPDRDHTGGLFALLEAAPAGAGDHHLPERRLLVSRAANPADRLYLLNPGQSLDVGDRKLTAFRPPLFDNPGTIGVFDDRTQACFSSDCFGAPMPDAQLAVCGDVRTSIRNSGRAAAVGQRRQPLGAQR